MKLTDIFPSKYLKAADLMGREPLVVIARCTIEKLGDDDKLVMYFQGKEKGLVTNRTNADRISYLYGQDTDDWTGKEIVLYTDMVNFQGKITEAIRVKPPGKKQSGPQVENKGRYDTLKQAPPQMDDSEQEVPF